MNHPNPAVRDWAAFRVVDSNHPRESIGLKHNYAYPLLDFQSAVDDWKLKTTHIIRGKDVMSSTLRQKYLYDAFGWKYPEVLHWGKVQVLGFDKMSTSKTQKLIQEGKISGWNDESLTTLRSLQNNGFKGKEIYDFWISQGLSERDVNISLNNIKRTHYE